MQNQKTKTKKNPACCRNGDTNTSAFSGTHMAGVAKHQLAMASSNNIEVQPVSLLQIDPQIMAHSPTTQSNKQKMYKCLYHQHTAPSSRKRNGTVSPSLYSVIKNFRYTCICQPHLLTSAPPPDVSMPHTCANYASSHLIP